MKPIWFKRCGWFYRPTTVQGLVTIAGALAFCAKVFWAVDRKSHSVSDTIYGVYPFFVSTFFLVDWIARRTSDPGAENSSPQTPGDLC
jgi:hypothetical protein